MEDYYNHNFHFNLPESLKTFAKMRPLSRDSPVKNSPLKMRRTDSDNSLASLADIESSHPGSDNYIYDVKVTDWNSVTEGEEDNEDAVFGDDVIDDVSSMVSSHGDSAVEYSELSLLKSYVTSLGNKSRGEIESMAKDSDVFIGQMSSRDYFDDTNMETERPFTVTSRVSVQNKHISSHKRVYRVYRIDRVYRVYRV